MKNALAGQHRTQGSLIVTSLRDKSVARSKFADTFYETRKSKTTSANEGTCGCDVPVDWIFHPLQAAPFNVLSEVVQISTHSVRLFVRRLSVKESDDAVKECGTQ